MYNFEFTPLPEPDPLAIEVFLPLNYRPSYVDDELAKRIADTVASCGDLPSAEAITLFAAAGVQIHERLRGKAADGHMAELLCWAATQRDRRKGEEDSKWFVGGFRARIWLLDSWIPINEVPRVGGYRGHLAPANRRQLHVAPEFRPYWFARQGVPMSPPPSKPGGELPQPPTPPTHKERKAKALAWYQEHGMTLDVFAKEMLNVSPRAFYRWRENPANAPRVREHIERTIDALDAL